MYFTAYEVQEKIGKCVKTLREFSGVPSGTIGTVTRSYQAGKAAYGLDITWLRPGKSSLTDGFSKDEYYQFLVEVEAVH